MTHQWQYQIRIYLGDEFAEVARCNPGDPAIASLTNILTKHHATMKCQFDAFADYVAEAEKLGPENYRHVQDCIHRHVGPEERTHTLLHYRHRPLPVAL